MVYTRVNQEDLIILLLALFARSFDFNNVKNLRKLLDRLFEKKKLLAKVTVLEYFFTSCSNLELNFQT